MAAHASELSFHAIRDAIVQTQDELRAHRRRATPEQRKAIDLKIRFLDKQQTSLKRGCKFGERGFKLDIL